MAKSEVFKSSAKLLMFLIAFSATGFSTNRLVNHDRSNASAIRHSTIPPEPPVIEDKLYDLVLNNFIHPLHPDSNQLQKLLKLTDKNHEKLVLQFYIDASSQLTLAAYVGHKKRQSFEPTPQILKVRENSAIIVDVSKNIVLTDQEISMNKNDIKTLRTKINDPTYKYIIFRPRKDGDHIVFDLYYTSDLRNKLFVDQNLGISTNPSPPKDAN